MSTPSDLAEVVSLPESEQVVETAASLLETWGVPALWLIAVIVAGLLAHWVIFAALTRATQRKVNESAESQEDSAENLEEDVRIERFMRLCVLRMRGPTRLVPALLGVQLITPVFAERGEAVVGTLRHASAILVVVLVTWLVLAVLNVFTEAVLDSHDIDEEDNLEARRIHTQLKVLRRVVTTLVVIMGGAAVLMTFPSVREFGATLLASAGLAGLVLGLAARPVLENLIAGVQVALTQPIRLDDVVVIDGEWGRIEEITTTYVVVKVWDQRRLIVPFSKILADSFQNWTRSSSDILGTAMVWADYTVPVEQVRTSLEEFVAEHDKWDGRVVGLQVTEVTERSVGLRALVSARDASAAWDLRCAVREHLIDYLQREHPTSLPREREIEFREHDNNDVQSKDNQTGKNKSKDKKKVKSKEKGQGNKQEQSQANDADDSRSPDQ